MKFDVNKFLEMSSRVAFALCLLCGFLLWVPSHILPFDIMNFRKNYGLVLFLVFAFSLAIIVSYVVWWLLSIISKKYKRHKRKCKMNDILKNLDPQDKSYLNQYLKKGQTSVYMDMTNPVHIKLKSYGVIQLPSGTNLGILTTFSGFISPMAVEILNKHPEYLK